MSNQYRLYLHPNGYFYHRVKVPADVRQLYGKQIEQRSLGTRDFRDAVRRLPAVIVEVDRTFALFRAKHTDALRELRVGQARRVVGAVPCLDVKRLAARYCQEVEACEDETRARAFKDASKGIDAFLSSSDLTSENLEKLSDPERQDDLIAVLMFVNRDRIEKQIAAIRLSRFIGDLERYAIAARKLAPQADRIERASLINAMIDGELKCLEARSDELLPLAQSQLKPDQSVFREAAVHDSSNEKMRQSSADLPLMSVISQECYASIGIEKGWSPKTHAARRTQVRQFIEICGDKPLNQYTQNDIRHLKSILFSTPPQSHGKKEYDGLSKAQIADEAKRLGLAGLSAESVRQIMTAVNLVFGWARAEHDIGLQNIVQPMIPSPSSGGSKKSKRQGFTATELQKLFGSPVFTGVKSDRGWFQAGQVLMHDTGRFWVPLLALYAGARLMESVQLLRQDIGFEDNVWFIDINNDSGGEADKELKNEYSARRIPVHPTLIELGFLDFVASVQNGKRLFPDIAIGPVFQRHRHASKMFNKLLFVAGIKGPKKVWHSLRHSFEQACRDSRVDSAIMDELQGHTQKGMRGVYGDGYGLPALTDGIRSIRYDGLSLTHIHGFSRQQW